jgi:hypothetical protein
MATHDPSHQLLFSHRDLVADLIRDFVREDWVAELDVYPSHLRFSLRKLAQQAENPLPLPA